jgi:predicted thioesterase
VVSSERRKSPRVKQRLRINFDDDPQRIAYSGDLSRTGLMLRASFVLSPGSRIKAAVTLPNQIRCPFQAVVQRVKQVHRPPPLGVLNEMGLRFLTAPDPYYTAFVEDLLRAKYGDSVSEPFSEGRSAASAAPVAAAAKAAVSQPLEILPSRPERSRTLATGSGPSAIAGVPVPHSDAPVGPAAQPHDQHIQPGAEGRVELVVRPGDLGAEGDQFPCSLSPNRAAYWAEHAAMRAVAVLLPKGATTVGVSMSITVSHATPTTVNARAYARAKLIEVSPTGRLFTFEVQVNDEATKQVIASGSHTRALLEPRKPGLAS